MMHKQRRPAFTLVELLVVIAIIAVLASLIVGATMRVIGVQSQKNTELLVGKLGSELNKQWQAVVDQADKEVIPGAVMTLAGNDGPRARVIWIKLRLKQQFPEMFAEATNPDGAGGTYITADPFYAGAIGATPAPGGLLENSICLALVLKNSTRGAFFEVDNLSPREIEPYGATGLKYIRDDWKDPVGFRRFPYNDTDLNPGGTPAAGFNDPVDPTGKLSNGTWVAAQGTTYQGLVGHPVSADASYKMVPYVFSNGGPNSLGVIKSFKARIGGYNP